MSFRVIRLKNLPKKRRIGKVCLSDSINKAVATSQAHSFSTMDHLVQPQCLLLSCLSKVAQTMYGTKPSKPHSCLSSRQVLTGNSMEKCSGAATDRARPACWPLWHIHSNPTPVQNATHPFSLMCLCTPTRQKFSPTAFALLHSKQRLPAFPVLLFLLL